MTETLQPTRRSALPIVLVAASALILYVTIQIVVQSSRGQRWDQRAMESVYAGPETRETLLSYLGYISIGTTALGLAACIVVALAQGKIRLAVAAVSLVAGANISTQVLKHSLIERPDFGYSTLNSLPSGHTTVVISVVLAALLVAPRALRPLFALLGSFAVTLTGASTVVGGWHRPGDIIAAMAVCLIWAAGVALVVGTRAAGSGAGSAVLSLIGSGAAGVFLIAVGVKPTGGWDGLVDAALVLGLIGIVVAAGIAAFARLQPLRQP